jgi:hypothetical protein
VVVKACFHNNYLIKLFYRLCSDLWLSELRELG